MNDWIKSGLIFLAGAAVGALGYKLYSDHKLNMEPEYEDIIEPEEVEDIKEENKEVKNEREVKVDREPVEKITSVDQEEYKRLLNDLRYQSEEENEPDKYDFVLRKNEPVIDPDLPYNISPDEFEEDDYESDEYTLYADGYITDNYGMPLSEDDIRNSIGENYMSYFGSYDDDQIWIRNERLRMDFSVIRDLDNFVDVAPPRVRRMVGL